MVYCNMTTEGQHAVDEHHLFVFNSNCMPSFSISFLIQLLRIAKAVLANTEARALTMGVARTRARVLQGQQEQTVLQVS